MRYVNFILQILEKVKRFVGCLISWPFLSLLNLSVLLYWKLKDYERYERLIAYKGVIEKHGVRVYFIPRELMDITVGKFSINGCGQRVMKISSEAAPETVFHELIHMKQSEYRKTALKRWENWKLLPRGIVEPVKYKSRKYQINLFDKQQKGYDALELEAYYLEGAFQAVREHYWAKLNEEKGYLKPQDVYWNVLRLADSLIGGSKYELAYIRGYRDAKEDEKLQKLILQVLHELRAGKLLTVR